jgi:hypothetical protein
MHCKMLERNHSWFTFIVLGPEGKINFIAGRKNFAIKNATKSRITIILFHFDD